MPGFPRNEHDHPQELSLTSRNVELVFLWYMLLMAIVTTEKNNTEGLGIIGQWLCISNENKSLED